MRILNRTGCRMRSALLLTGFSSASFLGIGFSLPSSRYCEHRTSRTAPEYGQTRILSARASWNATLYSQYRELSMPVVRGQWSVVRTPAGDQLLTTDH